MLLFLSYEKFLNVYFFDKNKCYFQESWVPWDGSKQFIHVDLLSTNRITKLEIQGHSYYYGFTTAFAIVYSLDGFVFKPYSDTDDGIIPTVFEGNHGPYDINQVYFAKPFSVRWFRNIISKQCFRM